MCERFNIGEPLKEKVKKELSRKEYNRIVFGETFPRNYVAVKLKEEYKSIKWGVKTDWSKNLIINAKLETIQQKPFFKKDFITNRCVVLATSYFEWNNEQKYEIQTNNDIIYMAGLIKIIYGQVELVILTGEAQAEHYLDGSDWILTHERQHEFFVR